MKTQTAIPQRNRLINQPTNWPRFYILPQTHYVKRQRAVNSPHYKSQKSTVDTAHGTTSKKQTYLQRGINKLKAAGSQAWLSLKLFGREVVHSIVKWCILPLAIVASFAMLEAEPAELPMEYHTVEAMAFQEQ